MKKYIIPISIIVGVFGLFWCLLFGLNFRHAYLVIPVAGVCFVLFKFIRDNFLIFNQGRMLKALPFALIAYIPVLFVIAPPVFITRWCESKIESYEQHEYETLRDKIHYEQRPAETSWEKVKSWFGETYEQPVRDKIEGWVRAKHESIAVCLSALKALLMSYECFLFLTSFLFIYSQIVSRVKSLEVVL